ncbi:MAG: endonuclease/exonuclease/phosphatase family protein [Pseudomonadota bacterium]
MVGLVLCLALLPPDKAAAGNPEPPGEGTIRIAQYNAALSRNGAGVLLGDILDRDAQVLEVARIILLAAPDILLINEFDRDGGGAALDAFAALLADGIEGVPRVDDLAGIAYPYRLQPMSNTGRPSGLDIDGDGRGAGETLRPADAWGYGTFPGQYAMAVLSRLPLGPARSWRRLPWATMPGALRPVLPDGERLHDDTTWAALRLSSKTHLAAPIALPGGSSVTLIAAHPTPPVFDGPADRNGRRNHDEIRLISEILDDAAWLIDDDGAWGGIAPGALVIVAGDLNADPADGDARRAALTGLLTHPRLQDPRPTSPGARQVAAIQGGANAHHQGDAALDTADWRDDPGPGNLRVDYVLPDARLEVTGAGIYWPSFGTRGDTVNRADTRHGRVNKASDHRLVWVDIRLP